MILCTISMEIAQHDEKKKLILESLTEDKDIFFPTFLFRLSHSEYKISLKESTTKFYLNHQF